MTRIIAGFAGSLPLAVPRSGTRPTSDRVREAIFSSLEARDALAGSRVLDLFAGSGALGLEAASRGASRVVLVDRAKQAQQVIQRNAARIREAAPADRRPELVVSAQSAHAYASTAAGPWDVVFVDPPYDLGNAELVRLLEAVAPGLAPDAVVVVERPSREAEPAWPSPLMLERERRYGETAVYWLGAA